MIQRIIYKNDEGGISIVVPSEEALSLYSIEEIAEKDVPSEKAYKIVPVDDIPSDRTFRNAWDIADSELTDGVGGVTTVFRDDPQHPDYVAPVEAEVIEETVE